MGRLASLLRCTLLVLAAGAALACRAAAQDFTGRWSYAENGQTATLDIRHERTTGRVTGTLSISGDTRPVEGRAGAAGLVIDRLGGESVASAGSMRGRLEQGVLVFTVVESGGGRVTMRMTRSGGAPAAGGPARVSAGAGAPAGGSGGFTPAAARDFAGQWEQWSEDRTTGEVVELTANGNAVSGTITAIERGYYSGHTTVKGRVNLQGTVRNGVLEFRTSIQGGGAGPTGVARRRGDYLVLRAGGGEETGYARPGAPLVRSAERSAEAQALARAVTGRVYSAGSQASGRGGFVGGRTRLALCSDGRIEYDASDLASTPGGLPGQGVDMGSSVARRGAWSIVLLAGAPVVRAQWRGTGSSYSLTAYFRVVPTAGGAVVDGRQLRTTGSC